MELVITEGISGYYHYHLSKPEEYVRGLCGARTMQTSIPLHQWGEPGGEHLAKRYTYCKECAALRSANSAPSGTPGAQGSAPAAI